MQTNHQSSLHGELKNILKNPIKNVIVVPNDNNFEEWHFIIHELDNYRYRNGVYWGILYLKGYPSKTVTAVFMTPNGKYMVHELLCLDETQKQINGKLWFVVPDMNITRIMNMLVSFFETDYDDDHAPSENYGLIKETEYKKMDLAERSLRFNMGDELFFKLFGSYFRDE